MSNQPPSVSFAQTLHVRDTCLCLATQRAARALARRFDLALKPVGLSNGQFSLLMALNRPEPPTLGALAETLAMDRTTATAALKPLERRGLVASAPDGADRRRNRIRLTEAGMAALMAAMPIWTREHAALDAVLGADAVAATRAGLRAIA